MCNCKYFFWYVILPCVCPQKPLQWRHNGLDGIANHPRFDCVLNRLITRRSKKASKLRINDLCEGNSPVTDDSPHKEQITRKIFPFDGVIMLRIVYPWSLNSPHKGPVTRKMFPFDDVIMINLFLNNLCCEPCAIYQRKNFLMFSGSF